TSSPNASPASMASGRGSSSSRSPRSSTTRNSRRASPERTGAEMTDRVSFSADEARRIGEEIGIDWSSSPFDVEQFRMGMDVELEHGTHDPETNVTDDDVDVTAKIARAHLNEFPDYYTRLAAMESEAEAYWDAQGQSE